MAAVYVDTSAVGRVLLGEPDAPAVLRDLAGFDQHVASRLLRVELRRLALREDALEATDHLLGGVALIPLDDAILVSPDGQRLTVAANFVPARSPRLPATFRCHGPRRRECAPASSRGGAIPRRSRW